MKYAIAKAFDRAATHYDQYADFQRKVGHELINFAQPILPTNKNSGLLDAGCGTGYFSRYWQQQNYAVTALDLADKMLAQAKKQNSAKQYIQGDLEQLPFIDNSFDITFSNLAIQWCDFQRAISELNRTTKQYVLFSTILDGSLYELNQTYEHLDNKKQGNNFISQDEIFYQCRNMHLTWQTRQYKLLFPTFNGLLLSLKGVGATYQKSNTQKGLTSRDYFKQLEQQFSQIFSEFSLTYHIGYGVIFNEQ